MDYSKDIKVNEYMPIEELKQKVLNQYNYEITEISNIKFKNTDKQRAVYKLNTNNGIKCLKKVYYKEDQLLFVYSVTQWLNIKNILCPKLLSTKKGHRFVEYNKDLFILTDWIEGRKCDYNSFNDIIRMSRNLARIHKTSKGFKAIEGSMAEETDNRFYDSQGKHFTQLLEFWNKSKHLNDNFSKLFKETFEYNYQRGKESNYILNSIDFSTPIGDEVSNRAICHLDYVNKNIIFSETDNIYVIDFDNTRIDMPVHDICYFLRRILKRESTAWDFKVFKAAMESYESIRKLSEKEYWVIYAMLAFPQKYWKISRDYYKNIKVCAPLPFYNMMKKVSEMQEDHNKFCIDLHGYINAKFKQ